MPSPMRLDDQPYFGGLDGTPLTSTFTPPSGGPVPRMGELGHVYIDPRGRRWQHVVAAATLTQAALASNVFYWSSAHGFTVDTDYTDSEATLNSVAGAFAVGQTLPTANQRFWALQGGPSITLNGAAVNFQAGGVIVASATVGLVAVTAAATAPVSQKLGTVHTAVDRSGGAGTVVVDLDIDSRSF
jgi:hypothetical protein